MIQKVFNCEVCEPLPEDDIIHVIFSDKNDSAIGFDWSWWNMEYKDPTAKNNLGVDCISRTRAIERLKLNFPISQGADNSRDRHRYMQALADLQAIKELPPVTPQEPRCRDCKWWKDSDGEYRRGCGAESKCPINTKTVYLGNGYCYKFESQESEDEK
jgi:hypothetical protein